MSASEIAIHLLGAVALLLWGMHMVRSGVERAFGAGLRGALAAALGNRLSAFLAGLGVTAALQSSTATGLMTTAFCAAGTVALVPALAVMLGANVGTALIVQVLSFDTTLVYPLLIAGGLALFRSRRTRPHDLGRAAVGLGLMLLSLHLLIGAISPAEAAPLMRDVLAALTGDPLLDLLLAAVLTWAAHSSVAIVVLIGSLAGAGIVTPEVAIAMVLGANLGSAVNPVIEGLGDPGRLRLPLGNLLNRVVGCAIALPLVGSIAEGLAALDPAPARLAADAHAGFNLVLAAAFLPGLPLLARLLTRLLPDAPRNADPAAARHLDPEDLASPERALANVAREALRLADLVEAMMRGAIAALQDDDRRRVAAVRRMDDPVDRLHRAIHHYLAAIDRGALSEAERGRLVLAQTFVLNLEHIGDIVDKNLMELVRKKIKQRLRFSPEGRAELLEIQRRLLADLRLAVAVFLDGDLATARRLVAGKDAFRAIERDLAERHMARLRAQRPESIATSALHLDILRDLKRIEAHIAAIAYPLLERAGELRASRLKPSAT